MYIYTYLYVYIYFIYIYIYRYIYYLEGCTIIKYTEYYTLICQPLNLRIEPN